MQRNDDADFTQQAEQLLELMTNSRTKESEDSEESDYFISSDDSDSETEDTDSVHSDSESDKNVDYDLNEFFKDRVENTKKFVSSKINNDTNNDIKFEKKMYRVILITIDPRVSKLNNNLSR